MWARIPILGWFIGFLLNLFLAIPLYYLWEYVTPKYMPFIPDLYQSIPFWDIVWIIMLVSIIKHVFLGGIFSTSSSSKSSTKD